MGTLRLTIPGLILILLITLGSCASTRISNEPQPEFKLNAYRTVVVTALHNDTKIRKKAEKAFAKQLTKLGLVVYLGVEITPSDIEYKDGDVERIYRNEGVQGEFIVELTGFDTIVVDQQPSRNMQSSNSGFEARGNFDSAAGNTDSFSQRKFAVTLWNPYNAEIIWAATAVTTGNLWAGTRAILDSVSKETAKKFKSDLEEETGR